MSQPAIDWRVSYAPPVFPVDSLPEPQVTWAELLSTHAFGVRPANDLPDPLPAWITDSPERLFSPSASASHGSRS